MIYTKTQKIDVVGWNGLFFSEPAPPWLVDAQKIPKPCNGSVHLYNDNLVIMYNYSRHFVESGEYIALCDGEIVKMCRAELEDWQKAEE